MAVSKDLLQILGAAAPIAGGLAFGPAGVVGGSLLSSGIGAYLKNAELDAQKQALEKAAAEGSEAAKAELAQRQAIIDKIEKEWTNPSFDPKVFTPEEIQYIGDYMPKVVQFVQEQKPEMITGLKAEAEKNYQRQALSQLAGETKAKPVQVEDMIKQKNELAQMQAAQAEQSRRASLLQDLANRGMLGAGQEALILSQAGQAGDFAARQSALQAGIQAAQEQQAAQERENARRQQAIQALGSLSTGARQQELGVEEANVNAIDAFNQRAATRLQQHLQNQADVQNQAALRNLQTQQNIAGENVAARNQASQYNQSRADRIAQILADAQNRKLEAVTGATGKKIDTQAAIADAEYERKVAQAGMGGDIISDLLVNAPKIASDAADVYKAIKPTSAPTTTPVSTTPVSTTPAPVIPEEESAFPDKNKKPGEQDWNRI